MNLSSSVPTAKKGQITFQKVAAHTKKNDGNDIADKLAGYASGKEIAPLGGVKMLKTFTTTKSQISESKDHQWSC
uniref:RNase H type-1 domain-containing protein n=1 Tax=Panagrolaimus sp. PS1159 TaxID=55785 RepID=A0AC35FP25_9BILA